VSVLLEAAPTPVDPRPGTPATPADQPRAPRSIAIIASALGVLGAVVSFAGSWIPSFWGDEAASVMSAERPLESLFMELGQVDAVHGAYYLFLHYWIGLFGTGELSVRLPSAIAVGFVVAGVVVLSDRLFTRRVALIAGIVSIVLPRITYMGAEGRSYAIATAVAVWLTILLLELIARQKPANALWVLYGAGVALAIYVFLYLGLMLVVHGAILLVMRAPSAKISRWLAACAVGLVVASPVIVFGLAEHGQLAFLQFRDYATFGNIAVEQWFGNAVFAVLGWGFMIVAGVLAIIRRQRAVALLALWLIVPMVALLAVDRLIVPTYNVRYLSFCAPAAAVLIAVGVDALRRRWLAVAAVVALVGVAAPTYVAQRGPFAKDGGSDLRQSAEAIAKLAKPGEGVVFDDDVKISQRRRLAIDLYPSDFAGLKDIELQTPFSRMPGLWDGVSPISQEQDRLVGINTVWAVESRGVASSRDLNDLEARGFVVRSSLDINRTTIYQLTRENP
jgi:mannosyltransferase